MAARGVRGRVVSVLHRQPALGRAAKAVLPRGVVRRLQVAKALEEREGFEPRVVRRSYSGVELEVQLEDALGASWYDKDWPPLAELPLLRRSRLKPGARVFDLGAHHGVVALVLAAEVRDAGRVLAVEAGAYEARLAERNRALNGAANVEVLHAAVAESSGTIAFGVDGEVAAGEGGAQEVAAFSIDDLAGRHGDPDVLYIDVEGFECQALRGARRTLAARPDCFVEVHHPRQLARYGGSQAEVLELLPEADYERFFSPSQEQPFQPLTDASQLPAARCFLVALGRRGGSSTPPA